MFVGGVCVGCIGCGSVVGYVVMLSGLWVLLFEFV